MKILAIDNLAVSSERRYLYRELSKQLSSIVYLLVPDRWREQGIITPCEPESTKLLNIISTKTFFGFRPHRIIFRNLKKIISDIQPDFIFLNSEPENYNAFQLAWTVNRNFPKIKIAVTTWRNIDYRNNPYPYKLGFINRLIEKYTKRKFDICFAHSKFGESLMKELSSWQVHYLPPPVDFNLFKQVSKQKREEKFIVGYMGRLVYEKGVDVLLKAIQLCDKEVRCHIIGNGPERDNLITLTQQLGIEERVIFQSAVDYKDVPDYMKEFDVLVLPSRTTKHWKEQFGRVLVEAMAMGVPVIGSKTGEIPFLINKCGILFDENNSIQLKLSIQKLQKDPQLKVRLIISAREKVERDFNIQNTVNVIFEAFKNSL